MKTLRTTIVACFILLIGFGTMHGQEMKVKKYDNPEWVRIGMVKFKPMMKDKATAIIRDYFMKADQAAGRKGPMSFEMATGEYDMMVAFPMDQGIESLNYEMSPTDIQWMTEMSKIAGGQEKAMAKLQEFYSYVDKMDSNLARRVN